MAGSFLVVTVIVEERRPLESSDSERVGAPVRKTTSVHMASYEGRDAAKDEIALMARQRAKEAYVDLMAAKGAVRPVSCACGHGVGRCTCGADSQCA